MRRSIVLFVLFLSLGVSGRLPAQAAAPSFACRAGAPPVERLICSDAKLAAEDRLMARLYALAKVSAFGRGPSNQPSAQRAWLKLRDGECGVDLAQCLARDYATRNEQLALAILFSHPDIALPELRRLDPEAAPMFEAIYLYARAPKPSAADRARIVALLQPYKDTPGGWGEPADAVKSDANFAEFIGVRSAGMAGESEGRAFPCAAAVRKPKLLDATASRFGSNMDNFVIRSDCPDTLPPLPKFGSLVEKRSTGMTDCGGGSIRFAYYRSFSQAALAARLATAVQLRNKPFRPFPPRRNVTKADIAAAVDELSAYYQRYGRADARQAPRLARQMIYDMLEEAWQC